MLADSRQISKRLASHGGFGWTFEKKKFEIPLCKGEQCLPLRGKHDDRTSPLEVGKARDIFWHGRISIFLFGGE